MLTGKVGREYFRAIPCSDYAVECIIEQHDDSTYGDESYHLNVEMSCSKKESYQTLMADTKLILLGVGVSDVYSLHFV